MRKQKRSNRYQKFPRRRSRGLILFLVGRPSRITNIYKEVKLNRLVSHSGDDDKIYIELRPWRVAMIYGVRKRCPTHPGAILRNTVLPGLKMSVIEAARDLGISRQTLRKILAEDALITAEMAVRIGKLCGNGPELWLGMQQAFRPLGGAAEARRGSQTDSDATGCCIDAAGLREFL